VTNQEYFIIMMFWHHLGFFPHTEQKYLWKVMSCLLS